MLFRSPISRCGSAPAFYTASIWTSILDQQTSVKFIQNACLDFSKAFDRLDHSILISKMLDYDFNRNVIMLVQSFLTDRMQCVKHNG